MQGNPERITALVNAQAGGEGSDWRDMAPDDHEGHERWCSVRDSDPCDCGPWEPVTFKVGDRVRVRLSGECPHLPAPMSSAIAAAGES